MPSVFSGKFPLFCTFIWVSYLICYKKSGKFTPFVLQIVFILVFVSSLSWFILSSCNSRIRLSIPYFNPIRYLIMVYYWITWAFRRLPPPLTPKENDSLYRGLWRKAKLSLGKPPEKCENSQYNPFILKSLMLRCTKNDHSTG